MLLSICTRRVIMVDLLAGLFGLGAWLSVNAMYTQLPILIGVAPESWNLASYIVILIQAANVGGLFYSFLRRFNRSDLLESAFIYVMMALGCVCLVLMAFFYQEVTVVGGEKHSVVLLVLVFGCALLACTSSLLFVPYMHRFPATYLVSYMVGEGLSALLPSIISLGQGVDGDPICQDGQSYTPPPRFSTRTYLLIAFAMQALSLVAFTLLDRLPQCQKARVDLKPSSTEHSIGMDSKAVATADAHTAEEQKQSAPSEEAVRHTSMPNDKATTKEGNMNGMGHSLVILLIIQAVLMVFSNGLFPSIQSYSCEPYGTTAYHLAINLSAVANPLACFLLFFVPPSSARTVHGLTAATLVLAIYIIVGAVMSPSPPLVGAAGGQTLVVVVWVLFTGLVSFTKLSIASICRLHHNRGLFWWGAVTQLGSLIGAVIAFCVINYADVFHSYQKQSPC